MISQNTEVMADRWQAAKMMIIMSSLSPSLKGLATSRRILKMLIGAQDRKKRKLILISILFVFFLLSILLACRCEERDSLVWWLRQEQTLQ